MGSMMKPPMEILMEETPLVLPPGLGSDEDKKAKLWISLREMDTLGDNDRDMLLANVAPAFSRVAARELAGMLKLQQRCQDLMDENRLTGHIILLSRRGGEVCYRCLNCSSTLYTNGALTGAIAHMDLFHEDILEVPIAPETLTDQQTMVEYWDSIQEMGKIADNRDRDLVLSKICQHFPRVAMEEISGMLKAQGQSKYRLEIYGLTKAVVPLSQRKGKDVSYICCYCLKPLVNAGIRRALAHLTGTKYKGIDVCTSFISKEDKAAIDRKLEEHGEDHKRSKTSKKQQQQ